jgi:hypothetical protein
MTDPTLPRTDNPDVLADPAGDSGIVRDREGDPVSPPSGMPRWVKVSGIIALALVLLFVVLHLTGLGGDHGPGRHVNGDGQEHDGGGHDPSDWGH